MKHRNLSMTAVVVSLLSPALVCATTLKTNNPEIVVKRVYCVDYNIGGVLVNKGDQPFRGSFAVAVKDEEGDVVGRNKMRLRVGAENGARFSFHYINTLDCKRQKFEFTVQ
ncbi:MAG: hypothetical protein FJY60_08620 [Betaproteobacteria bacterium]|nr:hypothetical protein [Betaproteobacteria bacterium]